MKEPKIEEFKAFRERLNQRILEMGSTNTNRFFNLDSAVYKDGALSAKTKELMGLVTSMVLRCDDCITYHIIRCVGCGVTADP